jgi:hypothetical protein
MTWGSCITNAKRFLVECVLCTSQQASSPNIYQKMEPNLFVSLWLLNQALQRHFVWSETDLMNSQLRCCLGMPEWPLLDMHISFAVWNDIFLLVSCIAYLCAGYATLRPSCPQTSLKESYILLPSDVALLCRIRYTLFICSMLDSGV